MTEADEKVVVQRGLWFEEFELGVRYVHSPGRTITEADNVLFTTLTMKHRRCIWMPPSQMRCRCSTFNGWSIDVHIVHAGGLSVAQLTSGHDRRESGIFRKSPFRKPIFHGDTMYAETVVTDKRESKSRPGEGIVTFAHTARNQHGDVVATATRKTMVRKSLTDDPQRTRAAWLFCPADRPERRKRPPQQRMSSFSTSRTVWWRRIERGPRSPWCTLSWIPPAPSSASTLRRREDHRKDLEVLARTPTRPSWRWRRRNPASAGSGAWTSTSWRLETPLGAPAAVEVARVDNTVALMGSGGPVRRARRNQQSLSRRFVPRGGEACPFADSAGGEGLFEVGARRRLPRHQGSRGGVQRSTTRSPSASGHQGRESSDPAVSHPRRLHTDAGSVAVG